jgi:photosystem II stability/assembly factor-like uncharacterized protein
MPKSNQFDQLGASIMFLIATQNGVFAWDESTQVVSSFGLAGVDVRHISSSSGEAIFTIDSSGDVWVNDGSAQWTLVKLKDVHETPSTLFIHPTTSDVYIGTEPPRLYRLLKGDSYLVADLTSLEGAEHWYTPYGHPPAVRSLAPAGKSGLYLNIHVGGVLRTLDGGRTWSAINNGLDLDVHQVFSSPANPSVVYAATATGFALSENQGDSWVVRNTGLKNLYTRGIAVNPVKPDEILISGSSFMPDDWEARGKSFSLFRSTDKGEHWERVVTGFPEAVESEIDTHCIVFSPKSSDLVLCGVRSGQLYGSRDGGLIWKVVATKLPLINSLCAVN